MKKLARDNRVIVLGGGIAGLGVAVGLAKRKQKVTVFSRSDLKGEASVSAAGILDPIMDIDSHKDPLLHLLLSAFDGFKNWSRRIEKLTGKSVGYSKTGLIYVARTAAEEKLLSRRVAWQKSRGVQVQLCRKGVDCVSGRDLYKEYLCAYYPKFGRVIPKSYIAALKSYARNLGVRFKSVVKTCQLDVHRGSVRGVLCDGNSFLAGGVVDARGAWAAKPRFVSKVPRVKPIRGQIYVLDAKNQYEGPIVHTLDGYYAVPWDRKSVLVGATVEDVGFKPFLTKRGLTVIREKLSNLLPEEIAKFSVKKSWAGLRPASETGIPIIGKVPKVEGFYVFQGLFRRGILLGLHTGDLLAQGITSNEWDPQLKPFLLK